ncbi:MAG: hypothetical protein GY940_07090 [bacterium]|nr:hypothetical protein [bacterium]
MVYNECYNEFEVSRMMIAGKSDAFNDVMSASYVPAPAPVTGVTNDTNFMKTMEKASSNDILDIDAGERDINRNVEDRNRDKDVNRRKDDTGNVNRDKREAGNHRVDEKEPETKPNDSKPNENETKGNRDVKEKPEAAGDTDQPGKGKEVTGKTGKNHPGMTIKEALKKHGLPVTEAKEAKEGMKANFSEAKDMPAANTAEKLVLKNLGDNNGANGKSADSQTDKNDELTRDIKFLQELEADKADTADKKDETSLLKDQPKTKTSQTGQDNLFIDLLNNNTKNTPQVNQIKVEKALNYQGMADQFQGIKDRVTENVENSIKFLLASGESRVTMRLNPPELGKVEVELIMKDNQVNARVTTENIAVKEVILNNLDQLKSNLANAGTGIDKFDVEVGGFKNQFDQHFSDGKSGGGKQGNGGDSDGTPVDPNEPMPGKIKNHRALSVYLGRSINVVI